jgi:hypothetical protein
MKMPPPDWYELSSDDTSIIKPLPLPSHTKGVYSWNVRHSPAWRELLCNVVGPYTTVVKFTKDVSAVWPQTALSEIAKLVVLERCPTLAHLSDTDVICIGVDDSSLAMYKL